MRAVVVDHSAPGRLAIKEEPDPVPGPRDALVRVTATSLNFGEVRRVLTQAAPGYRAGYDFVGEVLTPAADGSSPPAGARVAAYIEAEGWADRVVLTGNRLAPIPAEVTYAQAATLPCAGLTALYALIQGGLLLGKRVLVNGASGGVGHFACQLAHAAGAYVVGVVRRESAVAHVREDGADDVVTSGNLADAAQYGPFDVILESFGGEALGASLRMLAPLGVCVTFGETAGNATFEPRPFFRTGGARLYGLFLYDEVQYRPAGPELARLLRLVARGQLKPRIGEETDWRDIGPAVERFWRRASPGKTVIHFTD